MPTMTPALRKYVEAAEKAYACTEGVAEVTRFCRTVDDAIARLSGSDAYWILCCVPDLPKTRIGQLLQSAEQDECLTADAATDMLHGPNAKCLPPVWQQRLVDAICGTDCALDALATRGVLTRKQRAQLKKIVDAA